MKVNTITCGDSLTVLQSWPDECVDCVVTSPPYYGLRDYGIKGQLGLEDTPKEYIQCMTALFNQVRRVLKSTGTAWVNMGDSFMGSGTVALVASKLGRNYVGVELNPAYIGLARQRLGLFAEATA